MLIRQHKMIGKQEKNTDECLCEHNEAHISPALIYCCLVMLSIHELVCVPQSVCLSLNTYCLRCTLLIGRFVFHDIALLQIPENKNVWKTEKKKKRKYESCWQISCKSVADKLQYLITFWTIYILHHESPQNIIKML